MQQLNPGQVVWGSRERVDEEKGAQATRVLIAGVTGFIGRRVSALLRADGALVAGISRTPEDLGVQGFSWSPEDLKEAVRGADVVINLAGKSLMARRWTAKVKDEFLSSRVDATGRIVQAIGELDREDRPRLLINASGIGYYGMGESGEFKEDDKPGGDFFAELCQSWEAEAMKADKLIERVAIMRIGMVLGRGGGAFQAMLPMFRTGLGGWLGSGGQWMSWIHIEDLVGMMQKIIESPKLSGPFNGVAANPVTNREFSQTFARLLEQRCWPIPGFMVRMAVGDMADFMLRGQKALPAKITQAGYKFRYPTVEDALKNLIS